MAGLRSAGVLAWLHLARVFQKIQRLEQIHLRTRFDLTLPQFDVLAHLYAKEGISQQVLAERLLVTKGNICGIINRLADDGLVERRTDQNDRRANQLFLTERGRALAAEVIPAQEEFISRQMDALSLAERQALHRLLRQLDRRLTLEPVEELLA